MKTTALAGISALKESLPPLHVGHSHALYMVRGRPTKTRLRLVQTPGRARALLSVLYWLERVGALRPRDVELLEEARGVVARTVAANGLHPRRPGDY